MAMITLQNASDTGVTVLSNNFIDNYMPEANGEFVKIYIYLLRLLSNASAPFSLEQMADHFSCTERDIIRALRYWEKEKLLVLHSRNNEDITDISLCLPPVRPVSSQKPETDVQTLPFSDVTHAVPSAASTRSDSDSSDSVAVSASDKKNVPSSKPVSAASMTPDRVKELKKNEDVAQLLYLAEQYLGKTLTPAEMKKILFFYDGLKFSADLIEYLIDYSVSRGHKNMRYIEAVAVAWAEEGITTVAMAKEATSRYSKEYFTILKAMGINGRSPVETEVTLMNTWLKNYGFSMDIIQEACSRTVLSTGQASFQYADKILSDWKAKNVRTLADIRLLDAAHQKSKLEKAVEKRTAAPKPSSQNRFNNFHQRKYDFDEYEKKLLNH